MIEKRITPLPIVAGILMLVSAGLKLLAILGLLSFGFFAVAPPSMPRFGALVFLSALIPLLAITALAVVGGVFALLRRRWGWALAGAIATILPFDLLGVAATVLVALSREEFNQE